MQHLSRFNRDFKLTIQVSATQTVAIVPPLRVSFSASKSINGGLNKLTIRVYNLKPSNRAAIAKDAENQNKRVPVSLSVGYEGQLKLLFTGTIHRGENFREGADLVTQIECIDGLFDHLNSFTSKTVRGKNAAIDAILSDMPNTTKGKMTYQAPLIRPRVLVGSSTKLIDDLMNDGETWYIDNGKLYIIKKDEVTGSFIPVVSPETGLLNTPSRQSSKLTFDTLLNPSIRIGGLCEMKSNLAPQYNGVYKVETAVYNGDNYGADWKQSMTAILAQGYKVI